MSTSRSRISTLFITAGAFFAFFVFGFADNLKGPVLPEMLSSLNLSYSRGSNILLLSYLGFMFATLIAGNLADRIGNRAVMSMAGAVLALGVAGTAYASSVYMLYFTFFVLGFGLGTIEISANGIIVDTYPVKTGFYLNILAFFHGAGSMLAPLYAGKMIADGAQWNSVYRLIILLPVTLAISFFVARFTKGRVKKATLRETDAKKSGFLRLFSKELILFSIMIAAYVAAEIGIASWIVEFLQKEKEFSVVKSSLFLSLYFGFITAGRLLGSTFVDRIGHIKILRIVSLASILFLISGIFSHNSLAIILPLTGFFFSIIFPTITAAASERFKENRGSVLGILFFFAGLGGMAGPWLVGSVAEFSGIKWGLAVNGLFCLIMAVTLFLIKKQKNLKL